MSQAPASTSGIESHAYAILVGEASSTDGFITRVAATTEFQVLVARTPDQLIKERVIELSGIEPRPNEAHPADEALAVYLLALARRKSALLSWAVSRVQPRSNFFWARAIAERIENAPRA